MDLFYRGYDPSARITSGAKHLSAAAARFAVSMVMSIPQLPQSAWEEFKQRLSINLLWGLCLVIAGWLIVSVVGGLIGIAVALAGGIEVPARGHEVRRVALADIVQVGVPMIGAVLRGMGATVALPFLDAMVGAQTPIAKSAEPPSTAANVCVSPPAAVTKSKPNARIKSMVLRFRSQAKQCARFVRGLT